MTRLVLSAVAFFLAVNVVSAQDTPMLASDTVLRVRLTTSITTSTANVGDIVEAALIEYGPPFRRPGENPASGNAGRALLPEGTRVVGRVEHVRKADRTRRVRAELRLRFIEVDTGSPPALRTDARVLLIAGRRYSIVADVVTVNVEPRGEWGEPFLFGAPLGAGLGLLIGRNGKAAALGALIGFGWLYIRPLLHTTGDTFADVELARGQVLSLHSR